MTMDRREFLRISAAAAGAFVGGAAFHLPTEGGDSSGEARIPKRVLGKTGEKLSIIGMGGLVLSGVQPEHTQKVVDDAIERGVNYFDVAPTYGDSELKLGPALSAYRERVFLSCKTARRDQAGAAEELEKSLARLQTDHVDLYQLHAIADVEKDVKAALAKGGAMAAILEGRRQGKLRFVGFTAHTPEAALAAMKEFDFDTVMYPVNFVSHHHSSFELEVVAEAKKRNMGIISIKSLVKQKWPKGASRSAFPHCGYEPVGDPELARLALSWTLDQGVTAAIPPHVEKVYRLAVDVAPDCKQLTGDESARLTSLARGLLPIFPP